MLSAKKLGEAGPSAICTLIQLDDACHAVFLLVVPIYAGCIRACHVVLFMLRGLVAHNVFLNTAVCKCASGPDFATKAVSSFVLCLAYINAADPNRLTCGSSL